MIESTLLAEEFDALRRSGDEVAARHPDLARFLELRSNDPDVRQLLGGMALVAAEFRSRVRAELPITSQSILRTLFPQELRPTPSMVVVEFDPRGAAAGGMRILPRGSFFRTPKPRTSPGGSRDHGPAADIHWRTAMSLEIPPLEFRGTRRTADGRGTTVHLEFAAARRRVASEAIPDRLRLFVQADTEETRALVRAALLDPEVAVSVEVLGADGESWAGARVLGAIGRVGLDTANTTERPEDGTGLLPWPVMADEGLRLLYELGVFPAKFGFVELDLVRTGVLADPDREVEGVRIRIEGVAWPEHAQAATLRPFCTVAVNLQRCDARPIDLRTARLDPPLTPDRPNAEQAEVFSIESVVAAADDRFEVPSADRRLHPPASAGSGFEDSEAAPRYLHVLTAGMDGLHRSRLRFLGDRRRVPGQALSVRVLSVDRRLPETIGAGTQAMEIHGLPWPAEGRFVSSISPYHPPRGAADALWRLLGLIGTAGSRRIDAEQIREELRLAVPLPEGHRRATALREAIQAVETVWSDRIIGRAWRRCEDVRFDIDREHLDGPGDLALFADVLDRWARCVGRLGRVQHTTVRDVRLDRSYRYGPRGALDVDRGRVPR